MEKNIYERIDELSVKEKLSLSEVEEICNECGTSGADVIGDIIQFTDLTKDFEDLTEFELPNTKETWIAIAQALAIEVVLNKPIERTIKVCAEILELPEEDILQFLYLKQYIANFKGKWCATAMGVDFGYVTNREDGLFVTEKGMQKLYLALKPSSLDADEIKEIENICMSVNNGARLVTKMGQEND